MRPIIASLLLAFALIISSAAWDMEPSWFRDAHWFFVGLLSYVVCRLVWRERDNG